jgi:hypothetical protein
MIPLSLGLLALGLMRMFRAVPILIFSLGLLVLCYRDVWDWLKASAAIARSIRAPSSPSQWVLSLGAAVAFAIAVLCALAPPTYYDSLVYHLALPAKYLQEGRVGFVPYNHYSHFPQNMEMVFAWFLALGDDVSAQILNVFLAALTGLALYRLGSFFQREGGFRWDALLFVSAPCVLLLSSETYVEVPMAFWTSLALWACAKGLLGPALDSAPSSEGPVPSRSWFILSGLFGGFSAGIKYTGVITPALLTALLLVWPGRGPWRRRAVDAAALAFPAFALFLPWMVKNYFFTGGNPVFPFLPAWLPAKNVYLYKESAQAYFQVLDEYKGTSALLLELFQFPFRLASDALSFGGGYDVTGDLGWALPILLFPLAFLSLRNSPLRIFFLAYAGAHILLWLSLRPVLRFLFPVFPAVCLLSGAGLREFLSRLPAWAKKAAVLWVGLFVLSNGVLFYWVERVRDPFPVAWGYFTRDEYLTRKMRDAYPGLQFIDRELPADSRLLFVGDQRGYYCRRPYLAPMVLLPQPLKQWAEESESGDHLRKKLLELGFTHIFFNAREAERLKGYRVMDFTGPGIENWRQMTARLPSVYRDDSVTIFSLDARR